MSVGYGNLHKVFTIDSIDMVSLEDIRPMGRNYIMYLRLVDKLIDGQVLTNVPITLVPWDTMSAYNTFITNDVSIDPETRVHLHPSFKSRLVLYKMVLDAFGKEFEPMASDLDSLFSRYLRQDPLLTLSDRLYLRAYLHLDDTNAIHEFDATGLDIRSLVEAVLLERGDGSWTLRRSSFTDSTLIKSKILSYVYENRCAHIPIFHVSGFGYYETLDVSRGSIMPGLDPDESTGSIPSYTRVYPCFIDLLDTLRTKYAFSFQMYYNGTTFS